MFGDYRKALKDKSVGYLRIGKVTQKESQLFNSVKKVLQTIDSNKKLNTTQIKIKTRLYSNSVNSVLKLLKEKRIVKTHTKKDRQNNEKIYSIHRNRAIIYLCKLIRHKIQNKKWKKEMKTNLKRFRKFEKLFTRNQLFNQTFQIGKREITFNDEIPYLQAHEITLKALNGFFCAKCWADHKISELKQTSDNTLYCSQCGTETHEDAMRPIHRKEAYRLGSKNPFNVS